MYVVRHKTVTDTMWSREFIDAESAFEHAHKRFKHFAITEVRVYEEDTNGNLMLHVVWEKRNVGGKQ